MDQPLIVASDTHNSHFRVVKKTATVQNKHCEAGGPASSVAAVEADGRLDQILRVLRDQDTTNPMLPLVVSQARHQAGSAELWTDLSVQKDYLIFICDSSKLHQEVLSTLLNIRKKQIQRRRNPKHNAMVKNAITFIYDNFQHPISSRDVADHVCLSRNHFAEQFKKATKVTPSCYINRLRINKAKQLIIEKPHWDFATVAEHCGFSDAYYFSRIFKERTTLAPRDFKQIFLELFMKTF